MTADRIAAEYRAAVWAAQEALEAHRRGCHDCLAAKIARRPNRMCVSGWRLQHAIWKAQQLQRDYQAEQAQRAADQPVLFDVEDLADA